MSDSQQYEKVSVSSDGVTVDKRFEEDEFPVPAIAFEIQSSRSETVTIVLEDTVPEDVEVEDLGFHPEYGSEYWTIDEDRITFERDIEADSEYTTVYGIRATGTDNVEQFLTRPTIEAVDPPITESEGVADQSDSDIVRDVISGDSDSVPGLEDESDGADEDEDVGTLNLKDPNGPDAPTDGASDGAESGGESSGTGITVDADAGTLCGALASEIKNGNVDEEDVELLRKAFDLATDDTGSVDARIERLQTEVADLQAYTDALEEFLDENGTAEELLEEVQSDIEEFRTEVDEIWELAESQESDISAVEGAVEDVRSSIDGIESDVQSAVSDVESVESELESLESELSDLQNELDGIDVSEVENEIDDIYGEIEELKEWREQLSSVIGGD